MAFHYTEDDQPPDGYPGFDPVDEFVANTHCCTWEWWVEHYGNWAGWMHWISCGPLGWNITCPGDGGGDTPPNPKIGGVA